MSKGLPDDKASREDDFDLAPPQAASLAESLRAFGYELSTALADLIDNSISADARHVWIDFHWDGTSSAIAVTDDGARHDGRKACQRYAPWQSESAR